MEADVLVEEFVTLLNQMAERNGWTPVEGYTRGYMMGMMGSWLRQSPELKKDISWHMDSFKKQLAC